MGTYDLIDFIVVLMGYALSDEPTLQVFYERLFPFADEFMVHGNDYRRNGPFVITTRRTTRYAREIREIAGLPRSKRRIRQHSKRPFLPRDRAFSGKYAPLSYLM
jgi:hypothetical protein